MLKTLLLSLFIGSSLLCLGQNTPVLVSRMTETGVQLKWFPKELVQSKGVHVYRQHESGEWLQLTDAPIVPWSKPYNGISNLPTTVKSTVEQLSQGETISDSQTKELLSALSKHQGLAEYLGLYFEDRSAANMVNLSYRVMDAEGSLLGQIEANSDIWEGTLEPLRFWKYNQEDKKMTFSWKPESNRFHKVDVFASFNGGPAQAVSNQQFKISQDDRKEVVVEFDYVMKEDGYYEYYLQGAGYFGQYSIPTKHLIIVSGEADMQAGDGGSEPDPVVDANINPNPAGNGVADTPNEQWRGAQSKRLKRDKGLFLARFGVSGRNVILYWEISDSNLRNVEMLRSTQYNKGFKTTDKGVLSGRAGKYEEVLDKLGDYFYMLQAIDKDGKVHYSNKVVAHVGSTRGPNAPQNLIVQVDTGQVKLIWDPVEGTNIRYRVFRKLIDEDVFQPISFDPITRNNYLDKHHSRFRTRFDYYVVAFDTLNNSSLPSRTVRVELPDVVGPMAPKLKQVVKDEKYLQVVWKKSNDPDLSHYELYRKSNGTDFKLIEGSQLSKGREQFLDTDVGYNDTYTYALVAVDSAGNRSPRSNEIDYKMAERFVVEQLGIDTKLKIKANKGVAFISWKKREEAIGYEVYQIIGSVERKLTPSAIQENKFEVILLEGTSTYVVKALTESELIYKSKPIIIEG